MNVDPQRAGFVPDRLARVGAALRDLVESGRLPGAVFHVERRGVVAARDAIGRLDPASGEPMRDDAIFRIFSMTKPIVSVAAMHLFMIQAPMQREEFQQIFRNLVYAAIE